MESVASGRDAATRLEQREADLLVVSRSLPVGDPAPLSQLATLASGCELVQHLGPWCEGEERTGVVFEGFRRVFWHAWPGWWRRWLREYRGLRAVADPLSGATIAVAADADAGRAIGVYLGECGACCLAMGETPSTQTLTGAPAAVVWNGSQLGGLEAERLRVWRRFAREKGAPLIALLDFPRPETVAAARALGAAAVLGKPFDGGLLCDALREAIAAAGRSASRGSKASAPAPGAAPLRSAA